MHYVLTLEMMKSHTSSLDFLKKKKKRSSSGAWKATFNTFTCNQKQRSRTLVMKSPPLFSHSACLSCSSAFPPLFISSKQWALSLICTWGLVGLSHTSLLKCWEWCSLFSQSPWCESFRKWNYIRTIKQAMRHVLPFTSGTVLDVVPSVLP